MTQASGARKNLLQLSSELWFANRLSIQGLQHWSGRENYSFDQFLGLLRPFTFSVLALCTLPCTMTSSSSQESGDQINLCKVRNRGEFVSYLPMVWTQNCFQDNPTLSGKNLSHFLVLCPRTQTRLRAIIVFLSKAHIIQRGQGLLKWADNSLLSFFESWWISKATVGLLPGWFGGTPRYRIWEVGVLTCWDKPRNFKEMFLCLDRTLTNIFNNFFAQPKGYSRKTMCLYFIELNGNEAEFGFDCFTSFFMQGLQIILEIFQKSF